MTSKRLFSSLRCTLQRFDNTLCLRVKGELDLVSVAEFRMFVEEHACGTENIIFDLCHLNYLDSIGIRMFLRLHRILSDRKQRMILAHPSSLIRRILDVAGIGRIIPIFGTVEEGLSYLRSHSADDRPLAKA
jgi:anti-anti-sigma factor